MRHGMLTLGLVALALCGCVQAGNLAPDFGVATRQNVAVQIADPAPRFERAAPPASSGPRTALAQDRYNKGTVIQPDTQGTSSLGNGN